MKKELPLNQALRTLLAGQRVAALGTQCDDGRPFVSMVPYAIHSEAASLIIHVSALAQHTGHLQRRPAVSILVMQPEVLGSPVHALPRVTLEGEARVLSTDSPAYVAARMVYLQRFAQAQPMTELADFMFVSILALGARQVAGFGAARSLDTAELASVLALNA